MAKVNVIIFDFCDKKCISGIGCQDGLGLDYAGTSNVTATGEKCMMWTDAPKHSSIGHHNQCRNPVDIIGNPTDIGVWCYVHNNQTYWPTPTPCSVPLCDTGKYVCIYL